MPIPIPKGQQITVQKNLYPNNFCMPSMEVATNHYDINYVISGDRKMITPTQSYSYHAGNISVGAPYMYHRTISESDAPYERYLVKYTPEFAEPFIKYIGKDIFNELYEQKLFHFSEPVQLKIQQMLCEMLEEYNKNTPYKEIILQGMLFRLLTTIYENKLNVGTTKYKTPLTEPILNAVYYIENNYDKKLTLEIMAEEAHFSCAHFSRLFSAQLGIPFSEYVSNVRISHAKRLLLQTNKSIMEIALETGYCHGDYLCAQFKSKTGMTPTQFRQNSKNRL